MPGEDSFMIGADSLTIRFSRFGRGDQTDRRSEMLCNKFYA